MHRKLQRVKRIGMVDPGLVFKVTLEEYAMMSEPCSQHIQEIFTGDIVDGFLSENFKRIISNIIFLKIEQTEVYKDVSENIYNFSKNRKNKTEIFLKYLDKVRDFTKYSFLKILDDNTELIEEINSNKVISSFVFKSCIKHQQLRGSVFQNFLSNKLSFLSTGMEIFHIEVFFPLIFFRRYYGVDELSFQTDDTLRSEVSDWLDVNFDVVFEREEQGNYTFGNFVFFLLNPYVEVWAFRGDDFFQYIKNFNVFSKSTKI